jgi:hypothetical protein
MAAAGEGLMNASEIVGQAWQELPRGDRNLLEAIGAGQWQVCARPAGAVADEMLRSAGRGSLPPSEIARANKAVALWVADLRVVLINESHDAFGGLDASSVVYNLSRVVWHEWGHALSLDRAERGDIAAGKDYLGMLPEGFAKLVREAGYRPNEYTHEIVAEIYSMLIGRRRVGQTGRPPWLPEEVYELVRRVVGWNQ